jgi:SAM-dependent methyltransferase
VDQRVFCIAGPAPEELDGLLRIRDLDGFIEQAYRVILHRPPDLRGARRHARRLRLFPFYSRRRFLEKLQMSVEYRLLLARRLEECGRELDRERLALEQQRGEHQERERCTQELCGRVEGLLRQAFEPLRPIPGLQAQLLKQQRQHAQLLEQQTADLERQHAQLLEQQTAGFELLDRLLEQYRQVLEQQRAAHERQHAQLLEQQTAGFEPLDRLLEQYRQVLEQQRAAHERQHAQLLEQLRQVLGAPPRPALGGPRRADLAPIVEEDPGVGLDPPRPEPIERFVEDAYRLILRRPPEPMELIEDCEQLRGTAGRVKGEFLRALAERHAASGRGDDAPAAVPVAPVACRVCGGALTYKWSLKVLRGRHVAHYHECGGCRALQVVNPTWLEEAYAGEDRPLEVNPDVGRFSRNFSAYSYFAALDRAGLVGDRPVLLDFGGGYGLLAQMLQSGDYEVWQADPHVPTPFLAADRSLHRLDEFPDASFDLIFALEVLEHLVDPLPVLERLARLLKPAGTLMVSTGIYRPEAHDRHWQYLATEGGQHITFWSHAALAHAAERAGLRSLGYFPGNDGFFILISHLPADVLRARLARASTLLRDADHLRRITAPWDLQALGYVRVEDDPVAEPVGGDGGLAPQAGRGAA